MDTNIQRLTPLWEAFPNTEVQPAQQGGSGSTVFADVFRAAIENVRSTEDDVVKTEYLLSTGQLDNPAAMSLASSKAELAMSLLVELRERAMNAYSELTRISL